MFKLWLAGVTALGYVAVTAVLHQMATSEMAGIQTLYTAAQTQADAISASNR